VPPVGAFFIDIANAFVLQGFIQWLGRPWSLLAGRVHAAQH